MGERWGSLLSQTQNRPAFIDAKYPSPHPPPNTRGVPGWGPSLTRIPDFRRTKPSGILASGSPHPPNARGYQVGVLRAKSDFRFLPDKNDAGFSHLPRDPALAPVAAALAPSVAA